jgi:hypothetical protein
MVQKIPARELSGQFGIDHLTDNQSTLARREREGLLGLLAEWRTGDEQIEQDV